eukprot:5588283-Alexandrium_andersonii.AAC.1
MSASLVGSEMCIRDRDLFIPDLSVSVRVPLCVSEGCRPSNAPPPTNPATSPRIPGARGP